MANYDNSDKIGNQFWKQRTKHGRDRLFSDAETLREAANEYFEYIDSHPYYKPEQKKGNTIIPKDANLTIEEFKQATDNIVDIPTIRPYLLVGLCMYLNINEKYFNQFEDSIKDKKDPVSLDFSAVLYYIRQAIYQSQLEGGVLGTFNPMLVSRLLGLKDRQDITTNDNELPAFNISFQSKPDTDS